MDMKPVAYMIPHIMDFTGAKKVHFTRHEGCTLSDAELMDELAGSVTWRPDLPIDGEDHYVVDKDGVKHYPKALVYAEQLASVQAELKNEEADHQLTVDTYRQIIEPKHKQEVAALQAKIDALMLEYCPEEMTEKFEVMAREV